MDTHTDLEAHGPVTELQYLQWLTAHELDGHVGPFEDTYAASQYLDLATDDDIRDYLAKSPLYDCDQREWRDLANLDHERDIRARLEDIVASILRSLQKPPADASLRREVINTNFEGMPHLEQHSVDHRTSPALVIRATGPSFEAPSVRAGDERRTLGYSNIASCFDIVPESDIDEEDIYYVEQSSVFAR